MIRPFKNHSIKDENVWRYLDLILANHEVLELLETAKLRWEVGERVLVEVEKLEPLELRNLNRDRLDLVIIEINLRYLSAF